MAWLSGMLCSWDKELWAERQLVKALYFPSTHHTWAAIWFTLPFRLRLQPENRQGHCQGLGSHEVERQDMGGPCSQIKALASLGSLIVPASVHACVCV